MSAAVAWSDLIERLDADLRRAAQGGTRDEAAWEDTESRARHLSQVVGRHLGLTRDDVDDVSQEVMLRLQSAVTIRRLRLAAAPEGYLFVLAKNLAVDRARRNARERQGTHALEAAHQSEPEPGATEQVTPRWLQDALRMLRPEEQELLRLRFVDDWTIAEIARKIREPYSRVAVRLFRLLRRLRQKQIETRAGSG